MKLYFCVIVMILLILVLICSETQNIKDDNGNDCGIVVKMDDNDNKEDDLEYYLKTQDAVMKSQSPTPKLNYILNYIKQIIAWIFHTKSSIENFEDENSCFCLM